MAVTAESQARAGSARQIKYPNVPNSLSAGVNHYGEPVAVRRKGRSQISINLGNGAGLLPVPVKPKKIPASRGFAVLIDQRSRLRCREQRAGGRSIDSHVLCDGHWFAG